MLTPALDPFGYCVQYRRWRKSPHTICIVRKYFRRKTAKPKLPFAIAMKEGRPFTFAPALEKTGKIPNLENGCAFAPLSQASLMSS
jgi:hypothetical protein